MDLKCYTKPDENWRLDIRPAHIFRDWMDKSRDRFAYRCLPLTVANQHGWEILSPLTFDARWDGTDAQSGVEVRPIAGDPQGAPATIFGHGIITFHIQGLFRTEPGWNLWAGGIPNAPKDGIAPLTGIIETDWAPYTFTMNYRFTRPSHWVRFTVGEPICFIFPVQRGVLNQIEPRMVAFDDDPELTEQFDSWRASRTQFRESIEANPPKRPSEYWQKHYYRGRDFKDRPFPEHQNKLHLKQFVPLPVKPQEAQKSDAFVLSNPKPTLDLL